MSENPFAKRYEKLDIKELVKIINKPTDYQPLAVEAATLELSSRNVSEMDIESAEQQLASEPQKQPTVIEKKVRYFGLLADVSNPLSETPSTTRYINVISIFLIGLAAYQFYLSFPLIKYLLFEDSEWQVGMLLFFLPLILLPIAAILFWIRFRLGWILAMVYFSYTILGSITSTAIEAKRLLTDDGFPQHIQTPPLLSLIPAIIIFSFLAWSISTKDLRSIYKISNKLCYMSIVIGFLAFFATGLSIFL